MTTIVAVITIYREAPLVSSRLVSTPIEPAIFATLHLYFSQKIGSDELLRDAAFRRYWLSSGLNSFCAQITSFALPLCAAILLHATPAQMGLLVALQAVPFAIFSLPVGVWLDRTSKLPVMLMSETMSTMALASVAVAYWFGLLAMPWLYGVAFVLGTSSVVGGSAEQIFLTYLVGRDGLINAQTKMATTESASRLIGPGLGGILVQALSAPVAILVTACGFALSILNLRAMGVRDPKPAPSNRHPLHEITDGLRFVWGHPLLRSLAWGAGAWHLLFYGYSALSILFATRVLGMTPGVLGLAQTLGGVGVFAAALLLKPLNRRYGPGITILIGLAATAVGFTLSSIIPPMLFGSKAGSALAYAALTFFFDCGALLFFMPYLALRQKVTPDAFLGRMISTMRFLTVATAPIGAVAAGALAEAFSIRTGLVCIAAASLVLTAAMVWGSPLRSVRS